MGYVERTMWIILLIVLAGIIIFGVAIMILTRPVKEYRCNYKDPDKMIGADDEKI